MQRGAVAEDKTQMSSIEATIEWPADIYKDAGLSNIFVLSDDGQGLYLGLGHVAPFTGPPPVDGVTVVPTVRAAVYLTYKNMAELAELLESVVDRRRHHDQ
jgi:hypothetical protein